VAWGIRGGETLSPPHEGEHLLVQGGKSPAIGKRSERAADRSTRKKTTAFQAGTVRRWTGSGGKGAKSDLDPSKKATAGGRTNQRRPLLIEKMGCPSKRAIWHPDKERVT